MERGFFFRTPELLISNFLTFKRSRGESPEVTMFGIVFSGLRAGKPGPRCATVPDDLQKKSGRCEISALPGGGKSVRQVFSSFSRIVINVEPALTAVNYLGQKITNFTPKIIFFI